MADSASISRLRAEYPKEWSIISSGNGSAIAPSSLRARVRQLGVSPTDDVAQNVQELLHCLDKGRALSSQQRWAALRAAVLRKKRSKTDRSDADVRADLWDISVERVDETWEMTTYLPRETWLSTELEAPFPLRLPRRRSGDVTLADLTSHRADTPSRCGVDNTGNVRIWPAEEVLACVLVRQRAFASGRNVLELGAGHQGLAGWALAAAEPSCRVHITDGNEHAASSLDGVHRRVPDAGLRARVSTGLCRWDAPDSLEGSYSLVVAADCLFFEDFHDDLLRTIWRAWNTDEGGGGGGDDVLSPEAWFLAPSRGGSLDRFVEKAQRFQSTDGPRAAGMEVEVRSTVDPVVDAATAKLERGTPTFSRDRHQFLLVVLRPNVAGSE